MDEFTTLWELVSNDTTAGLQTYRLKVPGGWLVSIKETTHNGFQASFVTNPDGRWVLSTS